MKTIHTNFHKENYYSQDIELGSIEMCLREDPRAILSDFFGWNDLIKIARQHRLVRPESVGHPLLIEILAVRLGFELPANLEGISRLLYQMEKHILSISEPKRSLEEIHGTMAGTYRSLEAYLKDILHFYIGFLWPESEGNGDPGEQIKTYQTFCRDKFEIVKVDGIDGLTLGELVQLIHRINKEIRSGTNLENKLERQFHRKTIIPSKVIAKLETGLRARKYLAHDKGDIWGQKEVVKREFLQALESLKEFLQTIKQNKYAPIAIRIQRQITDEFNRQYLEAIDEDGQRWLVFCDDYLEGDESYFMHTLTNYVAVKPYISKRLR
jgi:hypothetical protein